MSDQAIALVRKYHADFGPTLAVENDLRVSRETLRGWMRQGGGLASTGCPTFLPCWLRRTCTPSRRAAIASATSPPTILLEPAAEEVVDPRLYAEILRQWSTDHRKHPPKAAGLI